MSWPEDLLQTDTDFIQNLRSDNTSPFELDLSNSLPQQDIATPDTVKPNFKWTYAQNTDTTQQKITKDLVLTWEEDKRKEQSYYVQSDFGFVKLINPQGNIFNQTFAVRLHTNFTWQYVQRPQVYLTNQADVIICPVCTMIFNNRASSRQEQYTDIADMNIDRIAEPSCIIYGSKITTNTSTEEDQCPFCNAKLALNK